MLNRHEIDDFHEISAGSRCFLAPWRAFEASVSGTRRRSSTARNVPKRRRRAKLGAAPGFYMSYGQYSWLITIKNGASHLQWFNPGLIITIIYKDPYYGWDDHQPYSEYWPWLTPATTNLQKVTQQQGVAGSAARDASQEPQRAEVGKSSSKPRWFHDSNHGQFPLQMGMSHGHLGMFAGNFHGIFQHFESMRIKVSWIHGDVTIRSGGFVPGSQGNAEKNWFFSHEKWGFSYRTCGFNQDE